MLNFKETITEKGSFYFLKQELGNEAYIWQRISKDSFNSLKLEKLLLFSFFTKYKGNIKTERFYSGRYINNQK